MAHFSTRNLPASGLGHRDPRRPHVTGGIGAGIPIFVTCIGNKRDPFYGLYRDSLSGQRFALYADRSKVPSLSRSLVLISSREPSYGLLRWPNIGDRTPTLISSRSRVVGDRTPSSINRTPPIGSRQPPDKDVDC